MRSNFGFRAYVRQSREDGADKFVAVGYRARSEEVKEFEEILGVRVRHPKL